MTKRFFADDLLHWLYGQPGNRVGRTGRGETRADIVDTDALIAERAGKTVSDIFLGRKAAFPKWNATPSPGNRRGHRPARGRPRRRNAHATRKSRAHPQNRILVRLWATPESFLRRIALEYAPPDGRTFHPKNVLKNPHDARGT